MFTFSCYVSYCYAVTKCRGHWLMDGDVSRSFTVLFDISFFGFVIALLSTRRSFWTRVLATKNTALSKAKEDANGTDSQKTKIVEKTLHICSYIMCTRIFYERVHSGSYLHGNKERLWNFSKPSCKQLNTSQKTKSAFLKTEKNQRDDVSFMRLSIQNQEKG